MERAAPERAGGTERMFVEEGDEVGVWRDGVGGGRCGLWRACPGCALDARLGQTLRLRREHGVACCRLGYVRVYLRPGPCGLRSSMNRCAVRYIRLHLLECGRLQIKNIRPIENRISSDIFVRAGRGRRAAGRRRGGDA